MNDNDIKDVLHERAVSVTPPIEVPATLKRRMRRRQGANLLGVTALVAVIAVGGFGAWRTLSPLGREGTKPAGQGTSTTTSSTLPIGDATVVASGDSVGGPWALTAKETAFGEVRLELVTSDAGCCADQLATQPPFLEPSVSFGFAWMASPSDPSRGTVFLFGTASNDVETITSHLADSHSSISYDASFHPVPVAGPEWHDARLFVIVIPGMSYANVTSEWCLENGTCLSHFTTTIGGPILATGESQLGGWRLWGETPPEARSGLSSSSLQLSLAGYEYGVGRPLKDPGAGLIDPQALVLAHLNGSDRADAKYPLGTLVFGSLGPDVASVEFRSDDDGSTTQAQVGDLLGTRGGWRGFGLVTDADSGVITARDASGKVLEQYALEPFVMSDMPGEFVLVVAEGSQGGTTWRMVVPDPTDPSCVGLDWVTSGGSGGSACESAAYLGDRSFKRLPGVDLHYGTLSPGGSVAVTTADGTTTPATVVHCPCGPIESTDYFYVQLPPGAPGKVAIPTTSPAT